MFKVFSAIFNILASIPVFSSWNSLVLAVIAFFHVRCCEKQHNTCSICDERDKINMYDKVCPNGDIILSLSHSIFKLHYVEHVVLLTMWKRRMVKNNMMHFLFEMMVETVLAFTNNTIAWYSITWIITLQYIMLPDFYCMKDHYLQDLSFKFQRK